MERKKLLLLLSTLYFILPFLLQDSLYEPHRDEMLYLAEGLHPAWGYMEVPPLLSFFAWITHLLPAHLFFVKCWPALLGAATFYICGRLIIQQKGNNYALILLWLSFVFCAYLRMFFLFQPNAPEIFFWTVLGATLIEYRQTQNYKWLYFFGIAAGLGMMSKYSVAFYITSLIIAVLLSQERKSILGNKHFYIASTIGLLIFLPNLYWQYTHHFPVVFHMKELQQSQLQYISPKVFIVDQIIMFLPCIFVVVAGLISLFFLDSFKKFLFIAIAFIVVQILLLLGHGKSYYAAGAYPLLLAFGVLAFQRLSKAINIGMLAYLLAIGIIMVPILLPVAKPEKLQQYYMYFPFLKPLLVWEDLQIHPLPQDFSDMLGWEEITQKVAKAYHSLPKEEQAKTFIFCNQYAMSGALTYFGPKYQLPEVYSDNASFLYWIPKKVNVKNFILVCDDPTELQRPYIQFFKNARFTDSLTNPFAREKGQRVMLATGADARFNEMFEKKIKDDYIEMGYK